MFMLIERMIQLLQENSIPGIVCILLERKRLSVFIFYEKLDHIPSSYIVLMVHMVKGRQYSAHAV